MQDYLVWGCTAGMLTLVLAWLVANEKESFRQVLEFYTAVEDFEFYFYHHFVDFKEPHREKEQ